MHESYCSVEIFVAAALNCRSHSAYSGQLSAGSPCWAGFPIRDEPSVSAQEIVCGVRHTLGIGGFGIIRSGLHRLTRCAGRWCRNTVS